MSLLEIPNNLCNAGNQYQNPDSHTGAVFEDLSIKLLAKTLLQGCS